MVSLRSIFAILLLWAFFSLVVGIKRVCYYGAWSAEQHLRPSQIDTSLCTHLIYAFADLDVNHTNIVPVSKQQGLQMAPLTALKTNNPNLKVLLSLGGWTAESIPFMELVGSEANIRTFAGNAVTFLRANNFDGLDVDWEFPNARGSEVEDKASFIKLLQILHDEFMNEPNRGSKDRLLLTVPVGSTEKIAKQSYIVPELIKYVDWVGLMTYDFHGEWEESVNVHNALYSNNDLSVDGSLQYWLSLGVPKEKLLVGVPLYGHKFLLNDPANNTIGAPSNGGEFITYYDVCKMIQSHNIAPVTLATEKVPYFNHNGEWVTYEDAVSISEKAQYIRSQGVGGVMVWSIDLDDYAGICHNGRFPLLEALKKGLETEIIVG